MVRVIELNFVLHLEIFVHYDGQLRAFHLILGCVPSYTSYQNSSSALTVGSSLLSYLDVRLPGFLPKGLTSEEAKDLGPRLVRQDSLKPIQDSSGDIVFQDRAEHIPVEALILGDSDEEGPDIEETNLVLSNLAEGMVKKGSMALDRWCLAVQASGGQASTQSTPQQTTPPVPQQQRKCQKGIDGVVVEDSTPLVAHLPTQVLVG